MKWARFEKRGVVSHALVEDRELLPVRGSPFAEWERTGERVALDDVKLLVPVVPATFYACGMNYRGHTRAISGASGVPSKIPSRPNIGYRAVNALVADGEAIVIPEDASDEIQYEAELVVVIGKQAKNLTEQNALECVFGYTIGNDVSERSWQRSDDTMWRSKNTDTFKPMGPWIETEADLEKMETIVRVNGKETNRFATADMIFGVVPFLVELTRYFTLWPGDVIWMGTDGASPDIKHGDVVEVEITGVGTLRNRFVREER
jgi:2-keto-4-pentenoate hydratase/2-oxohepta-3-ene-1,7-dioic acid hydratase in catechol pathway